MKTPGNYIDYGIYVDHKHSFIISLNHVIHEQLIQQETVMAVESPVPGSGHPTEKYHLQKHETEKLKKFYKTIIEKIVTANNIMLFGPATAKFELQKEMTHYKNLKNINTEVLVSNKMEEEGALHFVQDHYTPIVVHQEIFTVSKKQ